MIIFVMGICGSGKSTIGKTLAAELNWTFFDGDDYHSTDSRTKMASGIPLTDTDRFPWLEHLSQLARDTQLSGGSAVIACSALKAAYRDILLQDLAEEDYYFVFLDISREQAIERVGQRQAHFMKATMVDSQLACLERPNPASLPRLIALDATLAPCDLIAMIVSVVN
uniref:Gluconokinase n=2 Tax=Plectus sambesii TaxID=2011161 RepID=A0A914V624_9BILA